MVIFMFAFCVIDPLLSNDWIHVTSLSLFVWHSKPSLLWHSKPSLFLNSKPSIVWPIKSSDFGPLQSTGRTYFSLRCWSSPKLWLNSKLSLGCRPSTEHWLNPSFLWNVGPLQSIGQIHVLIWTTYPLWVLHTSISSSIGLAYLPWGLYTSITSSIGLTYPPCGLYTSTSSSIGLVYPSYGLHTSIPSSIGLTYLQLGLQTSILSFSYIFCWKISYYFVNFLLVHFETQTKLMFLSLLIFYFDNMKMSISHIIK